MSRKDQETYSFLCKNYW